jgi:hypothetical protein
MSIPTGIRRMTMTEAGAEIVKLGFLYPGHAAEDDYPRLAALLHLPVRAEVVHTTFEEDAHRVDALQEMGSISRLPLVTWYGHLVEHLLVGAAIRALLG